MANNNNPRVFLDIAVSFKTVGRIVIELFADTNRETAENFRALCTGEKGIGVSGIPLHYKGSIIHSVTDQMWYGGDITHGNGSGGESIYGYHFTDNNFVRKHDRKGVLSMVKSHEDAMGSQFMLLMGEFPDLDGDQVAFGQVLGGFDVIGRVEEMVDDVLTYPSKPVTIADCGQIHEGGSVSTMVVGCSVSEHYQKLLNQLRAWQLKVAEMENDLELQTFACDRGDEHTGIKKSVELQVLLMSPRIHRTV